MKLTGSSTATAEPTSKIAVSSNWMFVFAMTILPSYVIFMIFRESITR